MKRRILYCFISAVLLLFIMQSSVSAQSVTVNEFSDIGQYDWFYAPVAYVVEEGLFNGTGSLSFSPGTPVTRAMFIAVLGRFYETTVFDVTCEAAETGIDGENGEISFSDVESDAYYAGYLSWATEYGLIQGIGNNKFGPDLPITREDMATILYRYAEYAKLDTTYSETAYEAFSDIAFVSGYAETALKWCTDRSLINGYQNLLEPAALASRAQCAQIFYNLSTLFDVERAIHSLPEAEDISKIELCDGNTGESVTITDQETIMNIRQILGGFRYNATEIRNVEGWSYGIDIYLFSDGGNPKTIYLSADSLTLNGVTYYAIESDYFDPLLQIFDSK